MASQILRIGSPQSQRRWANVLMYESAARSYTMAFKGNSADAVMPFYNIDGMGLVGGPSGGRNGHQIVIPMTGELDNASIAGDKSVTGTGERLKLYHSVLQTGRFRKIVEVSNDFNAVDAGVPFDDQSYVRQQLEKGWMKEFDQYVFDALQGTGLREDGGTQRPTHILEFAGSTNNGTFTPSFGYNELQDVKNIAIEGDGFTSGGSRVPLSNASMMGSGGSTIMEDLYFIVDNAVANILAKDAGFQRVMQSGDVRGPQNTLLRGVQDLKIENMKVVVMPRAFGESRQSLALSDSNPNAGLNRDGLRIERCGMRVRDENDFWTGQTMTGSQRWSRCLLVGANALQYGMSVAPDLKFQERQLGDNNILGLKNTIGVQKTRFTAENAGDNVDAKIDGVDYGIITVDIRTK